MKIRPNQYARVYLSAVSEATPAKRQEMAKNFWSMVWRRGHMKWSKNIIASVEQQLRDKHGVKLAEITTPQQISEVQKKHITNQLTKATGKDIELVCHVKPHLLAGMVVTIDDERYDASLKGRLDSLYSTLAGDNK